MHSEGTYRAESGTVFRVLESDEGGVKVEVLEGEAWIPARIGMASLRLARSTVKLGGDAILDLPS